MLLKFRALPKGTVKMSAAEIASMFGGLRDMVVSAPVAEQDQRSLLVQRQQDQDVLIEELQQRVRLFRRSIVGHGEPALRTSWTKAARRAGAGR